jgi:hypothetical protein
LPEKPKVRAGRLYLPTVCQKEGGEHRDLGPELFRETAPTKGVEPELEPRHSVGVDQRLAAHKSEANDDFFGDSWYILIQSYKSSHRLSQAVLGIRDILVRIRIPGSGPLTNEFGSNSGSAYFFIDFKDAKKIFFFLHIFFL